MDFDKSMRQDIVGFVVYGAVLNILWRIAGNFLYYLFGDDDDKKKQMLLDAVTGGAFVSPITGLLGGSNIESKLDGHGSISGILAPELPLTQDAKKAEQYLDNNKYAEFASQALSILMQSSTGFDPQTAVDAITRVAVTLNSEQELDAARQSMFVLNAMLSIPQSQYEQMLIDKVVSGETDEDAALEDFIRYYKVHSAPLTFFLRNEENDIEAEENAAARFKKLLTERDKLHNPEDYEE
jgi:DnaJ-domain-containing protein 1